MLIILALLAQDYMLRDSQTSPVAAYGAFRLEREDCVESNPPVAVLHYAACVAKLRLTWSSADGKISALYEDDGETLTRSYRYPIRANLPDTCVLGGYYTAYRARPGSARDWRSGTKAFGLTLARCSAIEPEQIKAYQAEFADAALDYERAAVGLRSVASSMFKSLRRCTQLKYSPRHGGPDATATCTRREG
ncbi:hypothetical protein [Sphingomonas sp.]|uniref:hypothetical protein n=1 Tax=Sphingomonas sp. TaxID=28214 RepID=UPI003D6D90A6